MIREFHRDMGAIRHAWFGSASRREHMVSFGFPNVDKGYERLVASALTYARFIRCLLAVSAH